MKRIVRLLLTLTIVLLSLPSGDACATVTTLLTDLEYPSGLWPVSDRVYVTETAGRNTIYGGKVSLDAYSISTAQKSVLVDHPENSDAVAVASNGLIYLTSYHYVIPGEYGKVSVVNPATDVETHLLDIGIAF